jgi:hypothetical protein
MNSKMLAVSKYNKDYLFQLGIKEWKTIFRMRIKGVLVSMISFFRNLL